MKVNLIESYELVNANGDKLMLHLGRLDNLIGLPEKDAGFRWSMNGKNIPMLYRSGEWFNGFPKETTLKWFEDNGWVMRSKANHHTGSIHIYDLPKEPKATETATDWIPVSTGQYPEINVPVHVTYLSYGDNTPMCCEFAYWNGSEWHWNDDGSEAASPITAWKPCDEPYKGEVTPATEPEPKADEVVYFVKGAGGIYAAMYNNEGDATELAIKMAEHLDMDISVFKAEEITRIYATH